MEELRIKVKKRYGVILAILIAMVALLTSTSLGRKAETYTYPLNCVMQEHIHDENCYEGHYVEHCGENHQHKQECMTLTEQLICKEICHQHVASCYEAKVPEGTTDALGIVIPYAQIKVFHPEESLEDLASEKLDETSDESNEQTAFMLQEPVIIEDVAFTQAGMVDLADYEQLVELSYYDESSNASDETDKWVRITSSTIVPIDAKVRLKYYFTDLNVNVLKANDGKAYYTIPSPFRNNFADNVLMDANDQPIATATRGENNQVLFTFDAAWMEEMINANTTTLSGNFNLEIDVDPKQVGEQTNVTIQFEKSEITMNFEEDWREKRSNLEIVKSDPQIVETEAGQYFFEYSLSVTASADGIDVPNVKVVDLFTAGREYVEYYVGVSKESTVLTSNDTSIAPMETKGEDKPNGKVYLGEIVTSGIPELGSYEEADAPGTLVWDIGTLEAGETRILTYCAKIKEAYTHTQLIGASKPGLPHPSIKNEAKAYAGTYQRDTSEVEYVPNNDFASGFHLKEVMGTKFDYFDPVHNRNHTATKPTLMYDEDGNVLLRYRILLKTKESNKITYPNIKIRDELFNPNNGGQSTDPMYKPYIDYVEDSFKLFEGNVAFDQYDSNDNIPFTSYEDGDYDVTNPPKLKIDTTDKKFDVEVGKMEAGRCITLFYDIKIDKTAYTIDGSQLKDGENLVVKNTFFTMNANGQNENDRFDRYATIAVTDRKQWSRKSADSDMTADITNVTITPGDEVYDESLNKDTSGISSFEVPAGAFKYHVVLNEDGKWDMSGSTLTDTMEEHLRFSGYVKVIAYEGADISFSSDMLASEVEQYFKEKTPLKTSWLKIDGKDTFTFQPKQLGFDKNIDPNLQRTAYVLEYYALPHNVENITSIMVGNQFTITGDVGDGIYVGGNGSISIGNKVVVSGNQSFGIRKTGWFYERHVENDTANEWPNGRLYWIVEVNGTISKGRQIEDRLPSEQSTFKENSIVGVYKGSLASGQNWEDFDSVEEMEASTNLQKLTGIKYPNSSEDADYITRWPNYQQMRVTFNKDILLDSGESVFIIYQTTPVNGYVPSDERLDIKSFKNSVYTREKEADEWIHETDSYYEASSQGFAYKLYDGTTLVNAEGFVPLGNQGEYAFDDVLWEETQDSGKYSEWYVNINWNGEVSGLVEFSDQIPEGMEPVYVRMFEIGPDYDNAELGLEKPITPDIPELENEGWIKKVITAKEHEGSNMLNCTYYYHPKTNQIRWNVDNLYYDGERNSRNVVFQIVTRMVSDELLLSDESTFNNTIQAKNKDGKVLEDTATGTIAHETLYKNTTPEYQEDPEKFGIRIPFVVHANEYGTDLNFDGDTLTMIDEPGEYLAFDTESIKVYEVTQDSAIGTYGNIASSATITTTGNEHPSEGSPLLVDGDDKTLYKFHNSAMNEEKEILLTYRVPRMMNKFRIAFENVGNGDGNNFQFIYSILAQDSTQTNEWNVICDHVVANRTNNSQQVYEFSDQAYNKIKIVMHSCKTGANHSSNGWPAIAEFEVWGMNIAGGNVENQYAHPTYTLLDKDQWNAALETKDGKEILRITVPDNKWLKLEYTMLYTGPVGKTVKIANAVRWNGMPSESGSSFEDGSYRYDIMGSVDANPSNVAGLTIIKANENNLRDYLEGAVFAITECSFDAEGNITELAETKQEISTDANGVASIIANDRYLNTLRTNTVYCIREIIAPEGYILDSEPVYFAVATQVIIDGTMTYLDFPEQVKVHTDSPTFEYVCLNARGKVELDKKFLTNVDNEITPLDGIFNFGLFDEQNPTKAPLQVISIVVKNGTVTYRHDNDKVESPIFDDIPVGEDKAYYIYELDENMQPVRNGEYLEVDGATYVVKYPDTSPIVFDGDEAEQKIIENYLTFELPESGGIGTTLVKFIGFILVLLSLFLFTKRKQQAKGASIH